MRACEIMSRHVVSVGVDTPVREAIKLMLSHHVSGLPVVDAEGQLAGILSEGDFVRRAEIGTETKRGRWLSVLTSPERLAIDFSRQHGRKVGEVMTAMPITIVEETPLDEIVCLMDRHGITRLPVMRNDKIVGMVTRSDFMAAIANASLDGYGASKADENLRVEAMAVLSGASWRPCALSVSVRNGVVTIRGTVRSQSARRAAIVALESISGVKRIDDELSDLERPAPEEDYGGGDFVSLQEQPSTIDDEPL